MKGREGTGRERRHKRKGERIGNEYMGHWREKERECGNEWHEGRRERKRKMRTGA